MVRFGSVRYGGRIDGRSMDRWRVRCCAKASECSNGWMDGRIGRRMGGWIGGIGWIGWMVDRLMDEWMDEWMDAADGWIDGRTNGWIDGKMHGCMDGFVDERMDGTDG